jgi:nicotinamidase-related amidase
VSDVEASRIYAEARLGQRFTLGNRPGVLVVDFTCGFTDPYYTAGSNLSAEVDATSRLLSSARERGLPILFTSVGFESSLTDAGIWVEKFPALAELQLGQRAVEIDPRLQRRDNEPVVIKKGASAFFGTNLSTILVAQRVDTVVLCGATTSGCIRATAIDLLQHGFPTIVPRECVGDRARAPHEANLFDIHAKYADVVSVDEAIEYVDRASGVAETA